MKHLIPFVIYCTLVACMTVATFVAKGSDVASISIYGSWWFIGGWIFLVLASAFLFWNILRIKKANLLLHVSFILIFLGALITHFSGISGTIHLRTGLPAKLFIEKGTDNICALPFTLILNNFEIENYPGTSAPKNYVTQLTVKDGNEPLKATISMNHILSHCGYRFLQSSFDEDKKGVILAVNYDPWGICFSYIGYFLCLISFIWVLSAKEGEFRKLLHHPLLKRVTFVLIILMGCSCAQAAENHVITNNVACLYNSASFHIVLYPINLILGLLGFLFFLFAAIKRNDSQNSNLKLTPKFIQPISKVRFGLWIVLLCVFLVQTFLLGLRSYLAGRLPFANGFESMQLMAWLVMLFSLLFGRKHILLLSGGYLLSGFAHLVSSLAQMSAQLTPLNPVLISPLLSLHVSLMMMSYTLFAFTTLIAITSIILDYNKCAEEVMRLTLISHILLYPALLFLGVGICVGAVWANVSWGQYWSWDPKEVWALITFIVYALALHTEVLKIMNKPLWFHFYMVFAFFTLLMTYFGVNYFLGGMHSYGG